MHSVSLWRGAKIAYNSAVINQAKQGASIKPSCPHCGNNPVPHLPGWVDSTMSIAMQSLSQSFLETKIGTFFLKVTDVILYVVRRLFEFLGVIRFDTDSNDDVSDRAKVLIEEARARGWEMATMRIFGRATDVFQLILPSGREVVFEGLPRMGESAPVLTGWIDDKALLKERLLQEGVAVSKGKSFSDWKDAEKYFESAEKPLIVKPRLGSRGRHTSTHLYTLEDFRKAFEVAQQLCHHVIVEEHLVGSVYRGTVIDGKLAGVLAGDPPRITGDGVHSIRTLIEEKNTNRHERVGEVKYTDKLNTFLAKFSYTLDTVLSAGETIDLTEKIGLSYGGNAREVTPDVHPKLHAELERAANIIGDPFLGFDFITTDVSVDPDTVKWGIIECNTVPFINLHHDPQEGTPINVAGMVLDYVERNIR